MESKASLGVLFIHGIGEQSKGETLVTWLDPLVSWISSWLTGAQSGKSDADPPYCLVRSASLSSDREPSHAHVEIHAPNPQGVDYPVTSKIVVAEAYWAKSFPPPSVQEVTKWLLEIGPMAVPTHFGLQVRRAYRELRTSQGIAGRTRIGFVFARSIASLLLSIAILPVFMAALFLTALLRVLPIPGITQALMQRIQITLAGVIGDSTVFCASPSRLAAIITEVREAMVWLEPRCQSMIVVAHSQGAAVLRHTMDPELQLPPPGNLAGIVTLGSGLRKLEALLAIEAEKANGDRGDATLHACLPIFARFATLYWGFALLAGGLGISIISHGIAIIFLIGVFT